MENKSEKEAVFSGVVVGDILYDLYYGFGKVISVSEQPVFEVAFEGVGGVFYNRYGFIISPMHEKRNRTLYWEKPEIKAPEHKKRLVSENIAVHVAWDEIEEKVTAFSTIQSELEHAIRNKLVRGKRYSGIVEVKVMR